MAKAPGLGERKCPQCKEVIKADASICKHCHTAFSPAEVEAATRAASRQRKGALGGCLTLLLVIGSCTYMTGRGGSSADVPDKPGATAKADMVAFYHKTMEAIAPCDRAGKAMADAAGSGDLVNLYQAAGAAETACLPTPGDIRAIDVPASVGKEAHKKLTETQSVCEATYLNRWTAAQTMKKLLDDGGSIASQAKLREVSSTIEGGTLVCAAGLAGTAYGLGATAADLK